MTVYFSPKRDTLSLSEATGNQLMQRYQPTTLEVINYPHNSLVQMQHLQTCPNIKLDCFTRGKMEVIGIVPQTIDLRLTFAETLVIGHLVSELRVSVADALVSMSAPVGLTLQLAKLTMVGCPKLQLTRLMMQPFKNITHLTLQGVNLDTFEPVAPLKYTMQSLSISDCEGLEAVNIYNFTALKGILFEGVRTKTLSLTKCSNVRAIRLMDCRHLATMCYNSPSAPGCDVRNAPSLKLFQVTGGSALNTIAMHNLSKLGCLSVSGDFEKLSVTACPAIEILQVVVTDLEDSGLTLQGPFPLMHEARFGYTRITRLPDVGPLPKMRALQLQNNKSVVDRGNWPDCPSVDEQSTEEESEA